uniref:Cytochrome c biogenesis protein Ccs1 n=1 Tax=Calliarthron tuberculosum TaxID=48942 RepID=M4IV50_CALTB|nr:c-type cytochrome biogenesis protein [Calliarthron tuberculosum]AGA63747.1 c-type cytochrome biogenesis protein [Calliarthron tuberculosum]
MNLRNITWSLLKKISNLSFSISMFLIIAAISILGTVIEQDKPIDFYKLNYPENKLLLLNWKNIFAFGLNHLYSNYWFFCILCLFFLSLILCTFSTQLPVLKHARRWKFLYNKLSIEKMTCNDSYDNISFINFIYLLNLKNYYVFHKGRAIYAYKGLLGRIAPIFVHLSIIITLTGSVIGLSTGFFAQEIIPSGELFHVQNLIKSGYFSIVPSNIVGKVNDFFITYNEDQSVKQFFSNLSILDHYGDTVYRGEISVNYPLKFQGITFYQTDWKVSALRLQFGDNYNIEKSLIEVFLKNNSSKVWICNLKINKYDKISIVIPDLNNNIIFYSESGDLITKTHYGVYNIIYGVPVIVKDLMTNTGLQVKTDPGLNVAYFGFFILIISILLSYVSYSQIWANSSYGRFYLSGNTNRAFLSFEDEMMKIYNKYVFLMSDV